MHQAIPILDFVEDKSIWSQQISQSNGHYWTLNTSQIGLNFLNFIVIMF